MKSKSRRVLMAGAAAMVFSSVVGGAAFLTLSSPRADFLPDQSIWRNGMLPSPADIQAGYGNNGSDNRADFLAMDFASYGAAFGGGADDASVQLAAAGPVGGIGDMGGVPGENTGAGGQGAGTPSTFSPMPSALDALRSELERSIEPGSSPGNGRDITLSELAPSDTMTPGTGDQLQPIDQQPLPERPVPEPQSLALLLLGLLGLGVQRYRQRA